MKKAFFLGVVVLGMHNLHAQFCISYPIALPANVNLVQIPTDYLYGKDSHKVVEMRIKISGSPEVVVKGNDLNSPFLQGQLAKKCPEGCLYLITEITAKDKLTGQISGYGGGEEHFPYIKYFDPKAVPDTK